MTIVLSTPTADGVREAIAALREWQRDEAPMQLHPGDIGWNYRFGTAETAAVVRTWSRDGRILAVGMLDSPTVVRMTVAPDAFQDEDLARRLVEDFSLPERGEYRTRCPRDRSTPTPDAWVLTTTRATPRRW